MSGDHAMEAAIAAADAEREGGGAAEPGTTGRPPLKALGTTHDAIAAALAAVPSAAPPAVGAGGRWGPPPAGGGAGGAGGGAGGGPGGEWPTMAPGEDGGGASPDPWSRESLAAIVAAGKERAGTSGRGDGSRGGGGGGTSASAAATSGPMPPFVSGATGPTSASASGANDASGGRPGDSGASERFMDPLPPPAPELLTAADLGRVPPAARRLLSSPQVRRCLAGVVTGAWDFNAFELDAITGGRSLSVTALAVLFSHRLFDTTPLDPAR